LNRLTLAQGLHAPFCRGQRGGGVRFCQCRAYVGFSGVYLAGLVVGNRQTRAHNSVIVFLDAVTWLAQIVMFVLLGLLVWPQRLADNLLGAVVVALVLMFIARPVAVFLCWHFQISVARKKYSFHGLACVVRSASSSPLYRCWSAMPSAYMFFDVAFVVVLLSLLVQGWTVAFRGPQARHLVHAQRLGAAPHQNSICRANWPARSSAIRCRPTAPICAAASSRTGAADARDPQGGNPDAGRSRSGAGGRLRLSTGAAGKSAGARPFLRQYAARQPGPIRRCSATSFVAGTATLGALAEIYGLQVAADHTEVSLAEFFTENLGRRAKEGDIVQLGPIALLAHKVEKGQRHERSACGWPSRKKRPICSAGSNRCGSG